MTFSMLDRCGRKSRLSVEKWDRGWQPPERIGARRRGEKRTRAGRCDCAPPSDVVALWRKLRTKQYFHRSRLFVLFLTSRVPLFPSKYAGPIGAGLYNEGHAGKLAKRADNWDRCYFPDAPTMILVRKNAPRHRISNLYRFYRLFFFSHRAFRFFERRCLHRQHWRSSKMRFLKVEIPFFCFS